MSRQRLIPLLVGLLLCPLVAFGFIVKHRRYSGGSWLDAAVEMKWWIIGTILIVVIAAFWPDGKSGSTGHDDASS